jgi:thiamine-monophosphate kinase
MTSIARLGEEGFIALMARLARPARPRPVLGIGDDAAVVAFPPRAQVLLTTDLLTEGVHFRSAYTPGRLLGRKALAANLSDIAAMGGVPHSCVVSLGLPRDTTAEYARALAHGIVERARGSGVAVVGGDTCAAKALFVCVALAGIVERGRAVRRDTARAGDLLYVTGRLGASAAGLSLLRRRTRAGGRPRLGRRAGRKAGGAAARAIRAHLDPEPRVLAGRLLGAAGLAAAMIDLSDGLAPDLARLCRASGTGAVVEMGAIPVAPEAEAVLGPARARRAAIAGGEDYELLFAARPPRAPLVARLARRLRLPITRIGQMVPRRHGIRVLTPDGRYRPLAEWRGFEHFQGGAELVADPS